MAITVLVNSNEH